MIDYKYFLFITVFLGASSVASGAVLEPLDETSSYIVSSCERADFFLGIRGLKKPSNIKVEVRDFDGRLVSEQSVVSKPVIGGNSFIHLKHAVDTCLQHGWFNILGYVNDEHGKLSPMQSKVSFVVLPKLRKNSGFWGVAGLWGLTASTSRFTDSDALRLKKMGAHGVRFFVDWRSMRNAEDWNVLWRQIDGMYHVASPYDLEVLPVLVVAPEYAIASNQAGERQRARLPEDEAWYNLIKNVGQRYKGKITQWEIWNEPNVKGFWRGDIGAYGSKLNVAFKVLKNIDENNIVVTGGTSGVDVNWAKKLLRITDSFDVLAVHTYRKSDPENAILGAGHYGGNTLMKDLDDLRKVLPEGKKIWITEVGVNTRMGISKGLFSPVSEKEQASRLVRQSIIAKSMGVERAYWWMLRDGFGMGTGLLSREWGILKVKPSMAAMAWVNYLISPESKVSRFGNRKGLFQYRLETNGEIWVVAWAMQKMTTSIPCEVTKYFGTTGQRHNLKKGKERCDLQLDKGTPVFWRRQ